MPWTPGACHVAISGAAVQLPLNVLQGRNLTLLAFSIGLSTHSLQGPVTCGIPEGMEQ